MTHWERSSPSNLTYVIKYHPGSRCPSHLCLALTCPLTRSGRLPAPHRAEPRRCACSAPGFDARIWWHIFLSIIEGICKLPGLPGCLLFVLLQSLIFSLPFLEFLSCFVCSCQSGVGMGWRNTLCFVSCSALAVVMPSKVEGKVTRSNSIPLKCHSTLTRGKQPKNTLWDLLPAIYGLQCLQKSTSMDKNKKAKWRNDWQKHANSIAGSFAQNLL